MLIVGQSLAELFGMVLYLWWLPHLLFRQPIWAGALARSHSQEATCFRASP